MLVSAVASLRPFRGQCIRDASAGILSIHIQSRSASAYIRDVIPLRPEAAQRRFQSTLSSGVSKDDASKDLANKQNQLPKKHQHSQQQQQQQQQITFRKFAARALGAGLRSLLVAISPTGIRTAFRQSPGATSLALAALIVIAVIAGYTVKLYFTYFYHSQFTRYPKPIANSLRRALYYTNIAPDAELALKYYKRAMDQCAEFGLDPFSDEVLGIRIQTSYWLQKIGNYNGTLQVLEGILGDLKKWIAVMEQSVREGKVDNAGKLVTPTSEQRKAPEVTQEGKSEPEEEADDELAPENLWHKRRRILAKAIGVAAKLGELYSDEHVLDPDNSQKRLIWAVETTLTEFRRRKTEGVKEGEGDWLSPEETGSTMESLGRDYERKSQFHLAIPLFFQALRLCDSPCHRAVIMNNLAVTFAQHPIFTPTLADQPSETIRELHDTAMPTTRKDCLEAALNWSKNAYQHAMDVKGDERTSECDEACAVALCNWADVAAMMGKPELARKKYNQCIETSSKLDFPEGVKQARAGLEKLKAQTA